MLPLVPEVLQIPKLKASHPNTCPPCQNAKGDDVRFESGNKENLSNSLKSTDIQTKLRRQVAHPSLVMRSVSPVAPVIPLFGCTLHLTMNSPKCNVIAQAIIVGTKMIEVNNRLLHGRTCQQ